MTGTVRLWIAAALLCTFPAFAQSSAEVNGGIQFNFASPGARSLARGGAFIADASDATAAYTNPAGLVNLPARELSLELRSSRFVNTFSDRGHEFGPPTNEGTDTIAGLQQGRAANRVSNVAFASVVVPVGKFTAALYRHELANFAASAKTHGVFFTEQQPGRDPTTHRIPPAVSSLRLKIVGTGASAGVRVTDQLSFGFGLRMYDSEIDSTTKRYETEGAYGPPNYRVVDNAQVQHGAGNAAGWNAGFVYDINQRISIGGSYRQGFSFPIEVTLFDRTTPLPPKKGRFHVPSFYGLGLSVRPNDYWAVALDVNRISYSDMTRNHAFLFTDEPHYDVPDGTEVRMGTEFVLTRDLHPRLARLPFPITFAVGGWRDPDHSVRVSDPEDLQAILFRPTADDLHITFGVGVVLGTRAQIHAAADRSSRSTVISISTMARF